MHFGTDLPSFDSVYKFAGMILMKTWSHIEKGIDFIVEVMGRIGWVLILFCMAFGLADVILRYCFNSPTLWIGTTLQAAMVLMACMAGAYALNHDAFVKLDLFYAKFSPRKKAICDIITVCITGLYIYVLITKGIDAAMLSLKLKQVTPTVIPIPIYLIKPFIPFGGLIVLLVVIKKLVRDIRTVITGERI